MSDKFVFTAQNQDGQATDVLKLNTSGGVRIAIGAASAQSSALTEGTYYVCANVACFLAVGSNPTAVATGTSLPLFGASIWRTYVTPGDKIAVIRDTTDGYLWLIPAAQS
jgi:hypothetical protein